MTNDKLFAQLHNALGSALLERIQSGEASPADMNVARQFLKDNGIDGSVKNSVPLLNLAKIMPFDPEEEEAA
jgi:hypothetical protein|tara:strand:- start:1318 stop:1533 length:216 start_codon:yes stop_codon:yes gene_type:complete